MELDEAIIVAEWLFTTTVVRRNRSDPSVPVPVPTPLLRVTGVP